MAKLSAELQRYFLNAMPVTDTGMPVADTRRTVTDVEGIEESGLADSDAALTPSPVDNVTLDELLSLAGERTFGFLFVMLALPSALPIPAPGYSIPFGVVMLLLAWQLMKGDEQPWLPKKWRKKGFERTKVQGFIKAGLPWLRRIESISRPRLTGICTSPVGRLVLGIAIATMSICMLIPIPGTNTLPAIGIFVTGFGLLDDDGAISLAGLTICVLAAALVGSIFLLGAGAVDQGKEWFKNLLFNR